MRAPVALGAFGAALVVVFGGAMGIGHAVGPTGSAPAPHATHETHDAHSVGEVPEGLSSSVDGYSLTLEQTVLPRGVPTELAFRIVDADGVPVTRFTPTHDEDLHLVVVRRDGTEFQHLHPDRDADGRWSTPITLPTAGSWKVFTDTAPGDRTEALTLAADLAVPGDYAPEPLPPVSRTAQVDGYTVALAGDLAAGAPAALTMTVSRDGRPVTDLEPYLGAYGHLVTLRSGDLAYLHTHPEDGPAGPDIRFSVDVPTAGAYRLYLQFTHAGAVRTAELTATAGPAGADAPPHEHDAEHEDHG